MTNSTPKINNKVERHSPKWSGKKRSPLTSSQRSPGVVPKSSPISIQSRNSGGFGVGGATGASVAIIGGSWNNSSLSPKSRSPMCPASKSARRNQQSVQMDSPRSSPTNSSFYAGAKFSEPPSPASLPKPPPHWTVDLVSDCRRVSNCGFANLKMILNVQA